MAKNFVQPGDTISIPAPTAVISGDLVISGSIIGVALADAASGKPVQVKTTGVFDLPKVSAQGWAAVGTAIYWDTADKVATTTAAGNTKIGVNVATAENPSGIGRVRLSGF